MAKVTAKLTARGKHKGKDVVIECIETNDDDKLRVEVLKNGKQDFDTEAVFHLQILQLSLMQSAGLPNFNLNSLSGYWIALHEVYFDEPPKIKIEGDFDTFGLPYDGRDTSEVVF